MSKVCIKMSILPARPHTFRTSLCCQPGRDELVPTSEVDSN